MTLKGVARRLDRLEHDAHQRTLAELAKRGNVLRWAIYARDAEPDLERPGEWRSDTVDLVASLPYAERLRALELVDDAPGEIKIYPEHDDEHD